MDFEGLEIRSEKVTPQSLKAFLRIITKWLRDDEKLLQSGMMNAGYCNPWVWRPNMQDAFVNTSCHPKRRKTGIY
jgi:hypothetical protein